MIVSPNDNKQYHALDLDNGLKLVYVQAPDAHKSAASLVVNTGHFDDPVDRPGFAHFVEHLLFNGNEKYPDVNTINDFVAKNGGHCNAWTGTEHSNYFFDVQPAAFDTALDMLAHLFIRPLFAPDALEREQVAIHSEYKLKLKDDSRRIQQVHKQTCNAEHPYHKFSVGNRHTLSDLPDRPVIDELQTFWQENYQAKYMTLAIVHHQPFEQQKEHIVALFESIQSNSSEAQRRTIAAPLYLEDDLSVYIKINPVKELHKLNLTFAMPSMQHLYHNKMLSFVAHIIGDEGNGSLYDKLKSDNLINALSAGNGISGSNFKDFNISLELTELGETKVNQIIKTIFSYLQFLKENEPQPILYKEQEKLTNISFQFQEDIKPVKLANQIALNMQHYEEQDYIFGDYRMSGFCGKSWNEIIDYFRADNLRITHVCQSLETDKQAHWYHTPFKVGKIDSELLSELANVTSNKSDFSFPVANPYLRKPIVVEAPDFSGQVPVSLDTETGWQLWFKQDISYRVPKGNIYLGLDLPLGIENKRNQAMMRLFCDLFLDSVSEQHYQAETAGLHYNLYAHNGGITLYTSGLSNSQHELLVNLVDSMLNFEFQDYRFEEIKRQLIKHWRNSESNKPISQLFNMLNSHLIPDMANNKELCDLLASVAASEFRQFCKQLFSQFSAELLLYGNWTTGQAIVINQEIKQHFESCQRCDEVKRSIESLPATGFASLNKKIAHPDSAAVLYLQGHAQLDSEQDDIEKALFILASQILAPYSFSYLRTVKQLGYMAGSGYMPLCNVPGLVIYVQSHDVVASELVGHLKACLEHFCDEISQMSEEEFEGHKHAVIHQYIEQPSNLNQKCQLLWVSIGNKDYQFNQKARIAEEIARLNRSQLTNWLAALCNSEQSKGIELTSTNQT